MLFSQIRVLYALVVILGFPNHLRFSSYPRFFFFFFQLFKSIVDSKGNSFFEINKNTDFVYLFLFWIPKPFHLVDSRDLS